MEKQLAEAREEKGDLENYAVHEIKKTHVKLTNHRIENEDRQRQILNGESGIICDYFKIGQIIKLKNELMSQNVPLHHEIVEFSFRFAKKWRRPSKSFKMHYVLRAWKTFNVASWVQTPIFETQMS